MTRYICDKCYQEMFLGKEHRCSSVASACSGADARLADQLGPQKQPASVARINAQTKAVEAELCAVSPRSGDGPAWLSEYKTWLNEELHAARNLDSELYSKYHEGVADMAQSAMLKLNALLSQGHSQKQH